MSSRTATFLSLAALACLVIGRFFTGALDWIFTGCGMGLCVAAMVPLIKKPNRK